MKGLLPVSQAVSSVRPQMWWVATGALVAVALLFILSLVMLRSGGGVWWQALKAFSEASMVGALADWFAVVALFRHPLHLPIPHTAVLANSKPRVAASIASFFSANFWLPELVREKIVKVAPVRLLLKAVGAGDKEASDKLRSTMLQEILPMLQEPSIRRDLAAKLRVFIDRMSLENIAAGLLQGAAGTELPARVTASLAAEAASFVADNKDTLTNELADNLPMPAMLRDSLVGRVLGAGFGMTLAPLVVDKLQDYLADVAATPAHPLRAKVQGKLTQMMQDTAPDSQMMATLAEVKATLLTPESLDRLVTMLSREVAGWMDDTPGGSAGNLTALVLDFMESNPALAAKLDELVADIAAGSVERTRGYVEEELRNTVMNWDMDTMIAKIEEQVGSDLQFIRLNGTIVGGTIGLILFAITLFIH